MRSSPREGDETTSDGIRSSSTVVGALLVDGVREGVAALVAVLVALVA